MLRIKPNAIDSAKIRWHAIESEDLATGSITSRIIENGTIQGKDISDKANLEIQSLIVSGAVAINGASTIAGNLDMQSNLILNIGNAGTDFTNTGGLTLAGNLTANGTGNNYFAGNVGIGTTSPANLFDVVQSTNEFYISPTGDLSFLSNTENATNPFNVRVSRTSAEPPSGRYVSFNTVSSVLNSNPIGWFLQTKQTVANTTGTVTGMQIFSDAGDSAEAITVANQKGIDLNTRNRTTGTTTNQYGLYLANSITSTGAVTNSYGIYISAISAATNRYAFYNSTNAASYFGGNVGIGTTNPGQALDVGSGYIVTMGRIGVGTTAPATKLDLEYDTGVTNAEHVLAQFEQSGGTNGIKIGYKANGSAVTSAYVRSDNSLPVRIGSTDVFNTDNGLTVLQGGNVGIGTTSPGNKLSIVGSVGIGTTANGYNNAAPANGMIIEGKIGIGDTSPDTTLKVVGSICARADGTDCTAAAAGSIYAANFIAEGGATLPDYVFEPNYALLSIADLKNYINLNKHLPGVPSADEVNRKGLNLGLMIPAILEKTEENTLYIIQNNDQLTNQELRIMNQDNQISVETQYIASLQLKTDGNAQTIAELETDVNKQLIIVGEKLNELKAEDIALNEKIADINNQLLSLNTLQAQIDELKVQTNQDLNLAQLEANAEDISLIKLVLGTDRVANPGDVDILGKINANSAEILGTLKAKDIEAETVKTKSLVLGATDQKPDNAEIPDLSVGEGSIPAGENKVVIFTKQASETAKIFITLTDSSDGKTVYVKKDDIENGKNFTVKLDGEPSAESINFNWLIVH